MTTSRPSAPPVRIGALVPLTRPGWVPAGQHLLAGMEAAVRDVNAAGAAGRRPLELVVRDTAADPARAAAAVDELAAAGVTALAGEYHSVVARAVAARAHALGIPFLCSSAVLDALVDEPTEWVARLAPPQSRGWSVYADHLLDAGHRRIAVAAAASAYWSAGIGILRARLDPRGGAVVELDGPSVADAVTASGATALLLLVGYPDPALPIVRSVREDPRLGQLVVGAPAGQPEFAEWAARLGADGAGIPFLRYVPDRPTALAARVGSALRERLGQAPSFVAFEGYDAITVLAAAVQAYGADRSLIAASWPLLTVEATRGVVRFSRPPGAHLWQWDGAPIQVVDRDPRAPDRFRVLRSHR